MRPELLTPRAEFDSGMVCDVLGLVGVTVRQDAMSAWTPLEMAVAYDWAVREHLRASDNLVRARPKPSFITAAERTAGGDGQ